MPCCSRICALGDRSCVKERVYIVYRYSSYPTIVDLAGLNLGVLLCWGRFAGEKQKSKVANFSLDL